MQINSTANVRSTLPLIAIVFMLAAILPVGQDWQTWHVTDMAELRQPFMMPQFTGMPFAFFALPHALLSVSIGNAINVTFNILAVVFVARRYAGTQWLSVIALVLLSPFGLLLLVVNNIDWIPLASFLVADWLAYPMLAMKPQALGMVAVIRFKRNPNLFNLLPLSIMLIISVVIWGAWWQYIGSGLIPVPWNFAPFPYLIPVGVWLLYRAWKADDELLAACSTLFFAPYFAPYSLTGIHVLIASRNRRIGIWLWIAAWWLFIRSARLIA